MMNAEREAVYKSWLSETNKPDIPQGKIFDPWRLKVMPANEFSGMERGDQLLYLTSFGLLAPSTHNVIPERFRILSKENALDVLINTKMVLPVSDPQGRQATVSIGCTVANIQEAARCYGMESVFEASSVHEGLIKPWSGGEIDKYVSVGRIRFDRGGMAPEDEDSEWLQAMLDRKVVRALYDKTILDQSIATQMRERAQDPRYQMLHFELIMERRDIQEVGSLQLEADRTVFERPEFVSELSQWFYSNQMRHEPDGMRGHEFGFDDDYSAYLQRGFKEPEELVPDELANFARGGKLGIESSSAVGIISVGSDTPKERMKAGRLYEDLALLLHINEYCTAIHAGITEVEVPNLMLRPQLGIIGTPTMVFRIGKPLYENDKQRPHSARPYLTDLLLPEESTRQ